MADIIDIYMECGDFHTAVQKSGLPVHIAHLKLLKSGCLKIQDKIQYGSKGAKLGGKAEEFFQKLVPDAIDANKYFEKNNPVYDFCVKNLTIDVKYSSIRHCKRPNGKIYKNQKSWGMRTTGDQDFIVAFLEREEGEELNNPYILLLPMSFVDVKNTLNLTKSSPIFKEFLVEPEELQPILKDYAELKEQGII